MRLSLFDLHCDTAYEMRRRRQGLLQNKLAVSLQNAEQFEHYTQVMALWTDHNLSDEEGFDACLEMLENLKRDEALTSGRARIVCKLESTDSATSLILAVEDARILAGKIHRVDLLYSLGVRILTPLWKGVTCIGGSHDTNTGLTEFGRAAIDRAILCGMISDISHASVEAADEIFEIARRYHAPVIASHSNAHAVCPVSRNLRDRQVAQILATDGVIGLNLHVDFLTEKGQATVADILPHIEHFLALGAENAICLGCDMDGCTLPPDISGIAELSRLAETMGRSNYPDALIQKIFFENASRFAKKYII